MSALKFKSIPLSDEPILEIAEPIPSNPDDDTLRSIDGKLNIFKISPYPVNHSYRGKRQ